MYHIVIIGAGKLGSHLARRLQAQGHTILQVYSRTQEKAAALALTLGCAFTTELQALNTDAGIYIVAVKDNAIAEVASKIELPSHALLVHTSGSVPMTALGAATAHTGVLYPLQSFSEGTEPDWDTIPVCIEAAQAADLEKLRELAQSISGRVFEISSGQRQYLHLAAVFASNFTNYMLAEAEDILKNKGIASDILEPLVMETVRKAFNLGARNAQTGPALRNDHNTIDKHLGMLEGDKELQELYRLLSARIGKLRE